MELLERDGALAALAEARDAAARGRGARRLRHRRAGDRQDLARHPLRARSRRRARGCCSAPATTSRSRGRSARSATSSGASRRRSSEALSAGAAAARDPEPADRGARAAAAADRARARGRALGRRRDARLDHGARAADRLAAGAARAHVPRRRGAAGHPLRAALGAIRADDSVFLELAPLSERAVASLAGDDADEVYAATGGNPFYVTELLGLAGRRRPAAARSRTPCSGARLGSTTPRGAWSSSSRSCRAACARRVLDAVMPGLGRGGGGAGAPAAARGRRRGTSASATSWRGNAIRSSIPIAARRRLHAEILEALLAADADPADIVHHAEAAGAEDVVAEYALVAARRAAALESNREAYSHYRRASDFVDRLPAPEQAAVLEELATRRVRRRPARRRVPRDRARDRDLPRARRRGGGRPLHARPVAAPLVRRRRRRRARSKALEAVAILEPLGESVELARAYSGVSQLAMLAEDAEQALDWGERALELATRLGDERTRAHALVNIGTRRGAARTTARPRRLLEAHAVADAAGERARGDARARQPRRSRSCAGCRPERGAAVRASEALAYAREHEVHILASYIATVIAWLRLRAGEWDEAERITRREIESGVTVVAAARQDGAGRAGRAPRRPGRRRAAGRARGRRPTAPASCSGSRRSLELRGRVGADDRRADADRAVRAARRRAAAARRARRLGRDARRRRGRPSPGSSVDVDRPTSPPLRRDGRGATGAAAADAFGEVGWAYDRALMLSLLEDEEALVEAIEIARGLGAEPLTRRVDGPHARARAPRAARARARRRARTRPG